MTENWIHTEQQSVLQLGDNDITVTIPIHQLEDYSPERRKGEPVRLPTGIYVVTGWSKVEGNPNRVTVKLSRDKFVCKPAEVKLVRSNNIEWKLRKNNL